MLVEESGRKIVCIWLNPQFSMLFKSHAQVLGSLGRHVLMTSTQEPNAMTPQSALYICSRKQKAQLIIPIYF